MPDKSAENLARIRACDADWNENDHPRADNGQFTSGSGGGGAVKNVAETFKGVKVSKSTPAMKGGKFKNATKAVKEYADQERLGKNLMHNELSPLLHPEMERFHNAVKSETDRVVKEGKKEKKKRDAAKATLEKARPGIRQMKAEKLGYNKLTGEKASNHPEGEAHNMMVGAMESAGGDFYAAKNRLLNNPGTSEKVRAALKKMKAPEGSKPASMDGLVQKYIDDGDNERAATAIQLRSEMKMGHDIHGAVHNLLSKYDEAMENGWIDPESYDKNVDMLLNDVSGEAYSVLERESTRKLLKAKNESKAKMLNKVMNKPAAAPASKKDALVKKINADPKLKAEVMSLKGKPKAPAAKPAKSQTYKKSYSDAKAHLDENFRDLEPGTEEFDDSYAEAQEKLKKWQGFLKKNPSDETSQRQVGWYQGLVDTYKERMKK